MDTTRRLLVGFCPLCVCVCVSVCVCVLLGGEVKMFKNVYFRPVLELPLPYVHAYWWWKATICAHGISLKRSIITISSFVSNNTIQWSFIRTEVSYVHVTSQYSNTVRKYTFLNIFTFSPLTTHTHTHTHTHIHTMGKIRPATFLCPSGNANVGGNAQKCIDNFDKP